MAVVVIDHLEFINVDEHERKRFAGHFALGDRNAKIFLISAVITEPGKHVGERLVFEPRNFGAESRLDSPAIRSQERNEYSEQTNAKERDHESGLANCILRVCQRLERSDSLPMLVERAGVHAAAHIRINGIRLLVIEQFDERSIVSIERRKHHGSRLRILILRGERVIPKVAIVAISDVPHLLQRLNRTGVCRSVQGERRATWDETVPFFERRFRKNRARSRFVKIAYADGDFCMEGYALSRGRGPHSDAAKRKKLHRKTERGKPADHNRALHP